jgi:hypothetical protein
VLAAPVVDVSALPEERDLDRGGHRSEQHEVCPSACEAGKCFFHSAQQQLVARGRPEAHDLLADAMVEQLPTAVPQDDVGLVLADDSSLRLPLFTPYTAAAGGLTFSFNMRYVVPALLGAIAIFPLAIARERAWWRRAAWIVMVAVVLMTATARHYERVAAWPADGRAVAITAGVLILAGALSGRAVLERIGTRVVGASVLTLVMIVTLGWIVERHYLHDRYVAAGLPLDAVYGAIHDVHHERIAVFGTGETYPFYGTDLTNVVIRPVAPAVARSQLCRAWIELLGAERVRYVVLAHAFLVEPGPPDAWIAPDHGIAKVVGTSDGTLYRVLGPLQGDGCAPN